VGRHPPPLFAGTKQSAPAGYRRQARFKFQQNAKGADARRVKVWRARVAMKFSLPDLEVTCPWFATVRDSIGKRSSVHFSANARLPTSSQ